MMRLFSNGIVGALTSIQASFFPTTMPPDMDTLINDIRKQLACNFPTAKLRLMANAVPVEIMFIVHTPASGQTEVGIRVYTTGIRIKSYMLAIEAALPQPLLFGGEPSAHHINRRWAHALMSLKSPDDRLIAAPFLLELKRNSSTLMVDKPLERIVSHRCERWREVGLQLMLDTLREPPNSYRKLICDEV